jgi:hypothetical protein
MATALRMRQRAGYALWDPLCVYDLAERLDVEVRFADIPSMEGVYLNEPNPTVIISSLRPPGRQAFTCAHELGHHAFGHGTQYDELVEQRSVARRVDPNEFQADCFAGTLLMPKLAINRGFSLRGWDPAVCPPASFYVVATWLGVGYTTLIHHMGKALGMLSKNRAEELLRYNVMALRSTLVGRECREHLVVVDPCWCGRAVDVQVTDLICLPLAVHIEGTCIEVLEMKGGRSLAHAARPGIGRIVASDSDWSTYVRVRRKNYVGRGKYRFEEQIDDEE